eukprot:scaffold27707_cov122-Amphora_coffeaeformis.AAC.1
MSSPASSAGTPGMAGWSTPAIEEKEVKRSFFMPSDWAILWTLLMIPWVMGSSVTRRRTRT